MKHFVFSFLVFLSFSSFSQNDAIIFDNLILKDSSSIPVLFAYPDTVRNAILVTSMYPQGFVRLSEVQKKSSNSLKKTISKFNRSKQKQLWEITRYPELTSLLIANKDGSEKDLNSLLGKYPDKIKKYSRYFLKNNYSTLVEIETIYQEFTSNYKNIIKDFPENVKTSFNVLLNYPEVLTVLSKDMNTTVALGDLYKRNPQMVKRKSDSLNLVIAKENGIEYNEWKTGISKDTALQKELKQISKKYKEDMEEDDVYSTSTKSPDNDLGTDYNQKTIVNVDPYPYWAGYPYWYGSNYWYPYPWWFNLGFYVPIDGPFMFLGMPSYNFGWWYYNQPRYNYNHPNTSNYFDNHYQRYRNSNSGFNRSIQESYGGRRR
jgi:hypothetical protein